MTASPSCEARRDDLIALLYDDGDPTDKAQARDHLAQCVLCRAEYSELKSVRKTLRGWDVPAPIPLPQTRPPGRWLVPGLAAAAGLILGLGLAVAGRSALDQTAPAPLEGASTASGPTAARQFVSFDQLQNALQAQENRHQAEIANLRRSLTAGSELSTSPASVSAPLKNASTLSPAAIERLLRASEARQAQLFEARLAGLRTENDLQRQYDMAQIAAGLAYIDSRTGADAARTSELMKNLVRVTAKPQER